MVNVQEAISTARQRRPFTILGILIALLTVASFVFVASRTGGPVSVAVPGTTVSVVVAKQLIRARTLITRDMVEEQELGARPKEGFAKVPEFIVDGKARYALIDIPQGQPIVSNAIASSNLTSVPPAFLDIPSGYVAFTIPTSEQQGVAGYIQPGDYIGIIAVLDAGAQTLARTVFTNVHVLQTGAATYDAQGRPTTKGVNSAGASLTVLMTECDAEFLNWFLARAALRYVLESPKDYKQTPPVSTCPIDQTKGVTAADILARYGIK